ncbi:MAG: bifunctional riboflavin kinase/FAD synthetase [Planctomycetes bacterium]|nr:bifunctional riboflavin kinase/FAD synthetase [Planctomycetota bacterium]
MIVTDSLAELPATGPRGSVVSVGVFDGVHIGHREILRRNVARARELDARPTVVTFRDHPKQLLLGRAPRTLTSLEHRLELFRRAGIEHALVLGFDERLRAMPAAEFAEEVLVRGLGARRLVLGFDSKFGNSRSGTPEELRRLGYEVEVVEQVIVRGRAASSTAIREAVELGDLEAAREMLGRPFTVYGEVIHGDGLGARLGFPTANLDPHHELLPPNGVYACWATRPEQGTGTALQAVVNIGVRPTLGGALPSQPRVEAHLLDFKGDLYGEVLELEFVLPLRAERRFGGLDELCAQIELDVGAARGILLR